MFARREKAWELDIAEKHRLAKMVEYKNAFMKQVFARPFPCWCLTSPILSLFSLV